MLAQLGLIDGIVDRMADLLNDIPRQEFARATPCTEYTVGGLVDHLVGWVHIFEAAAEETDASRDPDTYLVKDSHGEASARRAAPP